jgi:ribonuclease E
MTATGGSDAPADRPTTSAARRRRRRRSSAARRAAAAATDGGEGASLNGDGAPATSDRDEAAASSDGATAPARTRGTASSTGAGTPARAASRSRRPASGSASAAAKAGAGTKQDVQAQAGDAAPSDDAAKEGTAKPARRRRGSGSSTAAKTAAAKAEADATEPDATPATGGRRRRAGGSSTKTAAPAHTEEAAPTRRPRGRGRAESPEAEASPSGDGQTSEGTRTRKARGFGRRRREEPAPIRRAGDKTMLITEIGDRDQIAVLEDRTLVEHYITRTGSRSMVGNIYLAKVQNVLPGMEAAFLDIGKGRNAVLYAGEVSYDEEVDGHTPRIEQVLKSGQKALVQVTKDPMGGKGARLTQEISLPGRYLVFVPNSQIFGVSRRLPDEERQRLKDILKKVRQPQHGLIVRTAAEGAAADDLRSDLERLAASWAEIEKSSKRGRAPRLLYEEPELTVRVIRDHVTEMEFKEIVTDSKDLHDRIVAYLGGVAPDLVSKVRMHEGSLPLLEAYHTAEQIQKALERKVWLPSGGYIIIDRTEAMTVIDVNTGKHVGKANLEETVTKTNLEAADEIGRQLRLRDIGGIIIIDFIDMLYQRNRDKVIQAMQEAMARDKTRSQVFDISPLGLLEVTRKRVSAGLVESFSETCPTCEGRGIILTYRA